MSAEGKAERYRGLYYRRYQHFVQMEYLGKVESFRVLKGWTKGKVLDVGCGVGYITNFLGGYGIEVNKTALRIAKGNFPHLELICACGDNLPFLSGTFDTVLCYNVLEHLTEEEREKTFAEMKRVLSKDGFFLAGMADLEYTVNLIIGLVTRDMSTCDPTHKFSWNGKEFRDVISKYFNVIEARRTSGYGRLLKITKYFKGDIMMKCCKKEI